MDVFEGEGGSTLKRTRLDSHGKVIGKPIDHRQSKRMADQGAVPQDRSVERCHVFGHLLVNKGPVQPRTENTSTSSPCHWEFPGATNPLNGLEEIIPEGWPGAVHFQYYVKVVPMVYQDTLGRDVHSTVLSMTRNKLHHWDA
eukprot:g59089.t1